MVAFWMCFGCVLVAQILGAKKLEFINNGRESFHPVRVEACRFRFGNGFRQFGAAHGLRLRPITRI